MSCINIETRDPSGSLVATDVCDETTWASVGVVALVAMNRCAFSPGHSVCIPDLRWCVTLLPSGLWRMSAPVVRDVSSWDMRCMDRTGNLPGTPDRYRNGTLIEVAK